MKARLAAEHRSRRDCGAVAGGRTLRYDGRLGSREEGVERAHESLLLMTEFDDIPAGIADDTASGENFTRFYYRFR